jgi:dynein heavy chain, axonemal
MAIDPSSLASRVALAPRVGPMGLTTQSSTTSLRGPQASSGSLTPNVRLSGGAGGTTGLAGTRKSGHGLLERASAVRSKNRDAPIAENGAPILTMASSSSLASLPQRTLRQTFGDTGGRSLAESASASSLAVPAVARQTLSRASLANSSLPRDASLESLATLGESGLLGTQKQMQRRRARPLSSMETLVAAETKDSEGASARRKVSFIDSLGLSPQQREAIESGDFVYMRRVVEDVLSVDSHPFALEVVSASETDPENYYTLSAGGVTRFTGTSSEFTPLAVWEAEHANLKAIEQIRFFKLFRRWKVFSAWRSKTVRDKQALAKEALNAKLFLNVPALRQALSRLHRLCAAVRGWSLFHVDTRRTYSLTEFTRNQAEKRRATGVWLGEFAEDARALVRAACDEVLDAFLDRSGIRGDTKMSFMERASLRSECKRLTGFIRLADFIIRDTLLALALSSAEHLLSSVDPPKGEQTGLRVFSDLKTKDADFATENAIAEADSGPLAASESKSAEAAPAAASSAKPGKGKKKWGKAAEGSAVVEAPKRRPLLVVAVQLQERLLTPRPKAPEKPKDKAPEKPKEKAPAKPKASDGEDGGEEEEEDTTALYAAAKAIVEEDDAAPLEDVEADLMLDPPLSTFRSRVAAALSKAMAIVSTVPALLTHHDLLPYTQTAAEDGELDLPSGESSSADIITQMVMTHPRYKFIETNVLASVDSAFEQVIQYVERFRGMGRLFIRNRRREGTLDSALTTKTPLEVLAAILKKFRLQSDEIERCPYCSDLGVLRVDSEDLKQTLIPSPSRVLQRCREVLPMLIRTQCEELLAELRPMAMILQGMPKEVEPFVEKVSTLQRFMARQGDIRGAISHTTSLAQLMIDQRWPLGDEEQTLRRLVGEQIRKIEDAATHAEASQAEESSKFAQLVDKLVKQLRTDLKSLRADLDHPQVAAADSEPSVVDAYMATNEARFKELKATATRYAKWQEMLAQPIAEYEALEDIQVDLTLKRNLWRSLAEWDSKVASWKATPLSVVNADTMGKEVQQYLKVSVRAERGCPGNMAAPQLRSYVEDFQTLVPVVGDLRSEALKDRHWKDIQTALGVEMEEGKDYTIGELIEMGAVVHAADIGAIATRAVQEAALLELFGRKVESVWAEQEFELKSYKESKEVFILGGVDDVYAALDESLVTINTILASRFVGEIRGPVEEMQKHLRVLSDTMDEWLTCQRNWMYLETIFAADDIKRQLPEESRKFSGVDKSWRTIMKRTYDNPRAIVAGTVKGMKEQLMRHNDTLDAIQKSLEEYLETKRNAFPRFYFLSDEELLEILAQTRDPQAVQPHLRKCFDALVRLEFGGDGGSNDIHAMLSPEGERIELGRNLKARGMVEAWLGEVEENMRKSLEILIKEGTADYSEDDREGWIRTKRGQVVATVTQIMWAYGTERALKSDSPLVGMRQWLERNNKQLQGLTRMVREDLAKRLRKVVVALVTVDVHARDIIDQMVKDKVSDVGSFTWQQQLRFYLNEGKVDVRQSDSLIQYGYEYQGCTSRLVITPLTDRCWMTITGAVALKLGAAPAGPAGTGKTESSKDLAKAVGIQCIVFNCSDQITFRQMGKHFAGLAQGGCWTCLDEFNRIDIEVLSVVAQQLQQLRQGVISGKSVMEFEGRSIKLNVHCVIITMNPGYAGRTELPDNLKILFRPVAMMVPDYALIAEIILYAEGFDDARNLARKMTKLYKLSSEQLSQQRHYDFGMRAVKSVLVMAGDGKRESAGTLTEDVVLIRAMQNSNVPKFLADDLPLFDAIVQDLFPGVEVPEEDLGQLLVAVQDVIDRRGLQRVPDFIAKVIQLYKTFEVRFGVVLVGPTGGGKTQIYQVLQDALTLLAERGAVSPKKEPFQKVHTNVLNPKCITMGELYGDLDSVTQEWTDGLASTIMRSAVEDESEEKKWTVFDGPVDALWIENMNTVLDDNKMLCLANGERIKLKDQMRMLFEVGDLEQASPATVSRLGVVFVNPDSLGWEPFVRTWMPHELPTELNEAVRARLLELFLTTMNEGLAFQRGLEKERIRTVDVQLATSLCALFKALLSTQKKGTVLDFALPDEQLIPVLEKIFAFSYVWALGGSIDGEAYHEFDAWCRGHAPLSSVARWPGGGDVFDFFLDTSIPSEGKVPDLQWKRWKDVVPSFSYDRTIPYFDLVVPTLDTVRFDFLLSTQVQQLFPVFLTGVTGTGKTVIVSDYLNRTSAASYDAGMPTTPIVINFSAQTPSLGTQVTIESKLEKKTKDRLGAPVGRRAVVFVDDVNMPAVEEYGAQPPIELLRQFLDFGGFYDREKLFWKHVQDAVLVCAAAPPGGGRAEVTPRFSRHFHMLCVPQSTDEVLKHIFGSILGGFLEIFPPDVQALAPRATAATIEVYESIREAMRPTPAKSHYTFNLRDVSKVFQGILMVDKKGCSNGDTFTRLWAHECLRVFHDRLVSPEDKHWFTECVAALLKRVFGKNGKGWTHEDLFEAENALLFVDFLSPKLDEGPGRYEEATSTDRVVHKLKDALDDYNMSNPTQMRLVFFRDAVEHVARIARILRQPRGNAMLVGVGGSGKQSLTRMACALAEIACMGVELTRGYGRVEFREDIKKMMLKAGVEGLNVAFLFTDTQIVEEGFLEDVNNILNTGEIPSLWASDETSAIVDAMRAVAQAKGIPETVDNCLRLFVSRVRDNLHIVLAMSPVGDALRVRCRNFPSLINCCTIDWFMPWPTDALLSVAQQFLMDRDLGASKEVNAAVCEMCGDLHTSVERVSERFYAELQRRVYTTPKSYLDLINLYTRMLDERVKQLGDARDTLRTGVQKLREADETVAGLKEDLVALQPVLERKQKEAAELLEQVRVEKVEADEIASKVSVEAAQVQEQVSQVEAVQADAQAELDKALPALEKAEKDLAKLTKAAITEVKSFAQPPDAVKVVLEAVCVLLGEKPDWDTAKKVMSRNTFLDDLKFYDKDNIPPKALAKIRETYIDHPLMVVEDVVRKSAAAGPMCAWVHAVNTYSIVAKEVAPKKARLAEMNAEVERAQEELRVKETALKEVLDKVAALQKQADDTEAEKQRLEAEAKLTQDRLVRAGKLTTGLADEQVRWKESVETLNSMIHALVGDVLLSAGFISYLGPFTGVYRDEILAGWVKQCKARSIPCSDHPTLLDTVGDPVMVRQWQIDGLPTDAVSTDNAIMVTRGERWPLMIDPQEQAKRWIKRMEARNRLATTRLTNPNMLRTLESCIRLGRPLIIEDIGESLDPALEPVLAKAIFKQGGRTLIRLGDNDVDYDDKFKFYMSTKMPNPHYMPEVCIRVTVINFTVTMSGLEDQLLGAVVKKEASEVEERRNKLVVSMASDKRQLKELEDKILSLLRNSKGMIVDDVELIDTLGESKELSKVINARLEESMRTNEIIMKTRDQYRPVAIRGAIIYFVIADLSRIDPMYQFSLAYFTRLYNLCIDEADKSDVLDTRLQNLISYLTATVYANVCRGLFESHKLLFSFLICVQVMRNAGVVSDPEWSLLLRGAGMTENKVPNPAEDLLSEAAWNLCAALEAALPSLFAGLGAHITLNIATWRAWAELDEPHLSPLPDPWHSKLNLMQKMLLLKVWREEKVLFAIKDFVVENLGKEFVESPPVKMSDIHAETRADVPVVFILSVGADPTGLLFSFARQVDYTSRLQLISLGQGQGKRARALIREACHTGDWVLLQNCHLAKSWMPELERIVERLGEVVSGLAGDEEGGGDSAGGLTAQAEVIPPHVHPDFRLWLTSMPAPYFPVPVLQNGVKLTNEPPKGVRANLIRSLANVDTWTSWDEGVEGTFADKLERPRAWKKLAFGLMFFHAIIQERRKFGPLGFNIRYEFNDSDLETSLLVLKRFLTDQPMVPWDAMRYVTGQINYGGRVTDDWDRRCLMNILSQYFTTDILGEEYKFSPSGEYYCPPPGELKSFQEYASGLPIDDGPEIFGMHNNANITFQANETDAILKTCLSIQPRTSGSSGPAASSKEDDDEDKKKKPQAKKKPVDEDEGDADAEALPSGPDALVSVLAADIASGLPDVLKKTEAGSSTFVYRGEHMDSLATVLSQEMVRFNKLLNVMTRSLFELQKAIRGEALMSDELDRMYGSLLNNQVPGNWEAAAYPSLKPLASWTKDLAQRIAFMRDWLVNGQPKVFWLSGFFFPQGFMTGTLQNHARKYMVPIDTLSFGYTITDHMVPEAVPESQVPTDGVLVSGLFMDGARWDSEKHTVADSRPGEMFAPIPIVHFRPEKDYVTDPKEYSAPVYKTSVRAGTLSTTGMSTNFVVAVDMPTHDNPNKWVLMGCALLCQLND